MLTLTFPPAPWFDPFDIGQLCSSDLKKLNLLLWFLPSNNPKTPGGTPASEKSPLGEGSIQQLSQIAMAEIRSCSCKEAWGHKIKKTLFSVAFGQILSVVAFLHVVSTRREKTMQGTLEDENKKEKVLKDLPKCLSVV